MDERDGNQEADPPPREASAGGSGGHEDSPSTSSGRTGGAAAAFTQPSCRLEKTASARRTVYLPLKRRAARFLEALAASGNVSFACEIAGIGKDRIYRHRRENAAFAAAWEAAKQAFAEKAEADDGIDLEALERDGLAVRRGRGGHVQIVSAHPAAWTRRDEDLFFSRYRESGNVAAAARAAGFSGKSVWDRAQINPAFRERLAEARQEATERLDFYLIEEGTNQLKGEGGARRDPQLAMWILKREDQRRAGTLRKGGAWRRPRSPDEVRDSILRKVSAIERHRNEKSLKEGWTQTADGHWIPPGYGKVSGDSYR